MFVNARLSIRRIDIEGGADERIAIVAAVVAALDSFLWGETEAVSP